MWTRTGTSVNTTRTAGNQLTASRHLPDAWSSANIPAHHHHHQRTLKRAVHPTQRKQRTQRSGRDRRNATNGTDATTDEASDRPFDTASFMISIKLLDVCFCAALNCKTRRPSTAEGVVGNILLQPFRQLRQLRLLRLLRTFLRSLRTLRALRYVG